MGITDSYSIAKKLIYEENLEKESNFHCQLTRCDWIFTVDIVKMYADNLDIISVNQLCLIPEEL